jgi:hypothetical protein
MTKQRTFAAVVSIAALGMMAATVRADVKIVSEVTVKGVPPAVTAQGGPDMSKPTVTTTYYKGNWQRVESGGTITITNFETGKITTLNPKAKTYYTVGVGDSLKAMADNPMLAAIKVEAVADVKPGGQTKVIAGKTAKNYKISATMKMTMDGAPPEAAAMFPTMVMTGEQWTTEGISLPIPTGKMVQNSFVKNLPPFFQNGMKPFTDKMASIPGFILSNTMSMEFKRSAGAPDLPGFPKEPIVTITEVKEISEAPLDDALFAPPADYKEVQPPATPGFGPGGRGGATPPGRP